MNGILQGNRFYPQYTLMEKRITAIEILVFIGLFVYLLILPSYTFLKTWTISIRTKIKSRFGIVRQLTPEDILKNPEEIVEPEISNNIIISEYEKIEEKISTEILEETGPTQKTLEKITSLEEQALDAKEKGNLGDAEKYLIEARGLYEGKDPDNSIEKLLAEIYFEQGQYVKASSLLKKIISDDESQHKATRQMGYISIVQGDFDTAKLFLEKAIQLRDDNPKYYMTLVDILYQQEHRDQAIPHLEKAQKLRPSNIDYLLGL
jgi:tetratricopeptide (TPR) repeat protein